MGQLDAALEIRNGLTLGLALVAVTVLCLPRPAQAHAFPQAENPRVGSTVTFAPARVSIEFDAPIEAFLARLDVLDSAGQNQDDGAPQVGPSGRELTVRVRPLKRGEYTVRWGVVAQDGHRSEGTYTFTLAAGVP